VIGCEVAEQGSILDIVRCLIFATKLSQSSGHWLPSLKRPGREADSQLDQVPQLTHVLSVQGLGSGIILPFAVKFVLLTLHEAARPNSTAAVVQLRAQRNSGAVGQPTFVTGYGGPFLGKLRKLQA
jgi:hypothetical protein